jgi:hypothetical protein
VFAEMGAETEARFEALARPISIILQGVRSIVWVLLTAELRNPDVKRGFRMEALLALSSKNNQSAFSRPPGRDVQYHKIGIKS